MRWSYQSSLFIFAFLIAAEVALSAPIYVDSDVLLEARSPVRTRAQIKKDTPILHRPITRSTTRSTTQAQAGPSTPKTVRVTTVTNKAKADALGVRFTARHFKKGSSTYRRTAAMAGVPTFSRTGRSGIVQGKTGRTLSPGKHVGERL